MRRVPDDLCLRLLLLGFFFAINQIRAWGWRGGRPRSSMRA